MEDICVGEEPQTLCVDDQYLQLCGIMGTLKGFQETCIGKLNGRDAIEFVQKRIELQLAEDDDAIY